MKVNYSSSLWNNGKGNIGLPQWIDWRFVYAGAERRVPAVYRFSKGIVFDIITLLEENKLRSYFVKYGLTEERLTSLQRRCAEQEHPYQAVPIREVWINGNRAEGGWSSSSAVSIPWARQDDELSHVRKAYASILKGAACFACERVCAPYPEADTKAQKLLRFFRLSKVSAIKLTTWPAQWFSPLDIHFDLSDGEDQREIYFSHPKTGIVHTLYFQKTEALENPINLGNGRDVYAAHTAYEVEPDLPQGDSLQFGSSFQYAEPPERPFSPATAAAIGIIGGADGPTAIFLGKGQKAKTVPCGPHGLPLYCCLSIPNFQKEESWRFVIEGINTIICANQEISIKK